MPSRRETVRPRSQQRLGQSGRRIDRHVLIGVGEHAEQSRGTQQVPVGQSLGPGVEHRHRIERPAQRQPAEQLREPVGHVVPGPVRFREGQQRRLGGQKSMRKRQETVEFMPDLPVVRLGGLHHASCSDARLSNLPYRGQQVRIDGHRGLRVDQSPRQLESADSYSIPGDEHSARHPRVVHVSSVGAAEVGKHQIVVGDLEPRVAPGDVAVVKHHRRHAAVPAEGCR